MKYPEKRITVLGFEILVVDFGHAKYMYPMFNQNAEYKVTRKGFKRLYHYLRVVKWIENTSKEMGVLI